MGLRSRKKKEEAAATEYDHEQEMRLVNAETRANNLFEKAAMLATIVTRRDQANHWQQAVDQLFSGGRPNAR